MSKIVDNTTDYSLWLITTLVVLFANFGENQHDLYDLIHIFLEGLTK